MQHFVSDKVFGPESFTENVYEDGVKNVALSALMGINGRCSMAKLVNSVLLGLISQMTNSFYCFSNNICIWTNEQWKDIYHERSNRESCQ